MPEDEVVGFDWAAARPLEFSKWGKGVVGFGHN